MKKILVIAIAVVALAAAGWLAFSKKSPKGPGFFEAAKVTANDTVIKITDKGFEPNSITIKKGTKVTFVDEAGDFAWPASDPHPTHTGYPGFDPEEPLKAGQAWAFTFNKTGSFGFHDHLHPGRRGTVKVE